MSKVEDDKIKKIKEPKDLVKEASIRECLGWFLRVTQPGLMPK